MTTQGSSMSDPNYHTLQQSETPSEPRRPDAGPYAQPTSFMAGLAVDAVLIDAVRAEVGPYVPSPWRQRRSVMIETEQGIDPVVREEVGGMCEEADGNANADLPWIDAFLNADDPDTNIPGVIESADAIAAENAAAPTAVAPTADAPPSIAHEGAPVPGSVDAWPLDEAGAAMRAFADDLLAHESKSERAPESSKAPGEAPVASTPPLPMWGDDDLMDIMPVKSTRAEIDSGEHWAARARRETEPTGPSEAAATALESLARRVRDGELLVTGYTAEMGDAAALAAALAALLGVRRS